MHARAAAAPTWLLVRLIGAILLAGCAMAAEPVFSCTDTMPGGEEPMCSYQEARLKVVNGCQNPCDKNAGCTAPTSYDCAECAQCSVTATTPIWNILKCADWERGGGACNPVEGCPECKQNFTVCSLGGTFLPSSERMHTATGPTPLCKSCPPGRYAEDAVLSHVALDGEVMSPHNFECFKCASGRFQDEEGQASCKECYPGSVTNTLALTGARACTACFKGKISSQSTSKCVACDPGKSTRDQDNQTSCTVCEAGLSSGTSGRKCTLCRAGEFQEFNMSTSCTVCPGGWYSDLKGAKSCTSCPKEPELTKITSPIPNDASAHNSLDACESCDATNNFTTSSDQSSECSVCTKDGQYYATVNAWTPWPEKPRFSSCLTDEKANYTMLLSSNPSNWEAPAGGRKPKVKAKQIVRIGGGVYHISKDYRLPKSDDTSETFAVELEEIFQGGTGKHEASSRDIYEACEDCEHGSCPLYGEAEFKLWMRSSTGKYFDFMVTAGDNFDWGGSKVYMDEGVLGCSEKTYCLNCTLQQHLVWPENFKCKFRAGEFDFVPGYNPIGKSLYKDDGTLSCSGTNPGICRKCDIGYVRDELAPPPDNTKCVQCPLGKTSNWLHNTCIWCDTMAVSDNSRIEHPTCLQCPVRQFHNKDRTKCQAVTSVRLVNLDYNLSNYNLSNDTASSGGATFRNFDELRVLWDYLNVPRIDSSDKSKASVRLCPLRYVVDYVHGRCEDGGGDATSETFLDVATWEDCAKKSDSLGAVLFNHHKTMRRCEIKMGIRCIRYVPDTGWFSLQLEVGSAYVSGSGASPWELGCSDEKRTANFIVHDEDHHDKFIQDETPKLDRVFPLQGEESEWTYGQKCITDTTFVKARVGMKRRDAGAHQLGKLHSRIIDPKTGNDVLGNECPGPSDDCICPSAAHCLMRMDQSSCPKGTRSIDYLAYCRDAFHALKMSQSFDYTSNRTTGCTFFAGGMNETICKRVEPQCRCARVTNTALGERVFSFSEGNDKLIGNTAPTIQRDLITVEPKNIFPTSPLISCRFPDVSEANYQDSDIDLSPQDQEKYKSNPRRERDMRSIARVSSVRVYRGDVNQTIKTPEILPEAVSTYRSDEVIIGYLLGMIDPTSGGGSIEPVDPDLWPGDLAALAHSRFPARVLASPKQIKAYIEESLLDTRSVNDTQILTLAKKIYAESASRWSTFADSRDATPTPNYAFAREGRHDLLRGGQDKFRCALSLHDGCELGHEVKGAEEVHVQSLRLENQTNGHEFHAGTEANEATAELDVVVVGAGFIAGRSDYVCSWSQPSLKDRAFEQTTEGTATSSTKIRCKFPKWKGRVGTTQLSISGPITEYQGCYNLDMLLDRMNVLSSEEFSVAHGRFSYDEHGAKMTATTANLTVTYAAHGLAENDVITIKSAIHNSNNGEFKVDAVTSSSEFVITGASQDDPTNFTAESDTWMRWTKNPNLARRNNSVSGLYSCQLQVTKEAADQAEGAELGAGVFALSFSKERQFACTGTMDTSTGVCSKYTYAGCRYFQGAFNGGEAVSGAAFAAQFKAVFDEKLRFAGALVDDDMCNALCPVKNSRAEIEWDNDSSELTTLDERDEAREEDMKQSQRCGSEDGDYHSVFVARHESGIPVGTFQVIGSQPDPPRWPNDTSVAVKTLPGGVALSWEAPQYLGGHEVLKYELQFRLDTHKACIRQSDCDDTTPAKDRGVYHAVSHAMMCEVDRRQVQSGRTGGTDRDSDGKTYRVCSADDYAEDYIIYQANWESWFDRPDHTTALDVGRSANANVLYLDPDETYTFRVRVQTQQGWSDWSSDMNAKPRGIFPPKGISNLYVDTDSDAKGAALNSSSIRVRFNPPVDDGGVFLSHYIVRLIEENCDASDLIEKKWNIPVNTESASDSRQLKENVDDPWLKYYTIMPATTEFLTMTNLDPSTPYRVTLSAVNAYGMISSNAFTVWKTGDLGEIINVTALVTNPVSHMNYSDSKNWYARREDRSDLPDTSASCYADGINSTIQCTTLKGAMDVALNGANVPSGNVEGKRGRVIALMVGYHQADDVVINVGGLRIRGGTPGSPEKTVISCGKYDPEARLRGRCFTSGTEPIDVRMGGGVAQVFLQSLKDLTFVPVKRVLKLSLNAKGELASPPPDESGDSPELGGALLINGVQHPVSISNVIFANFSAQRIGGAILIMDSNSANSILIHKTLFLGCYSGTVAESSTVASYAGALGVINAGAEVSDSTFRGNGWGFSVRNGGAIAITTHSYLQSALDVHRLIFDDFRTELHVSGSGFYNNAAVSAGGAIFVSQGTLTVSDSQFGDKWFENYCDDGSITPQGRNAQLGATGYSKSCGGDGTASVPSIFEVEVAEEVSVENQKLEALNSIKRKEKEVTNLTKVSLSSSDMISKSARTFAYRSKHLLEVRSIANDSLLPLMRKLTDQALANLSHCETQDIESLVRVAKDINRTIMSSMRDDFQGLSAACSTMKANIQVLNSVASSDPALITSTWLDSQTAQSAASAVTESSGNVSYCKAVCLDNCNSRACTFDSTAAHIGNVYTPPSNGNPATCTNGGRAVLNDTITEANCRGFNDQIYTAATPLMCSDGRSGITSSECTGITGFQWTEKINSSCTNSSSNHTTFGVSEEDCRGITGYTWEPGSFQVVCATVSGGHENNHTQLSCEGRPSTGYIFYEAVESFCQGDETKLTKNECEGLTGYEYTAARCVGGCYDSDDYSQDTTGERCMNGFAPGDYYPATCKNRTDSDVFALCESSRPSFIQDGPSKREFMQECFKLYRASLENQNRISFMGSKEDCEGRVSGNVFVNAIPARCEDGLGNAVGDSSNKIACEGNPTGNSFSGKRNYICRAKNGTIISETGKLNTTAIAKAKNKCTGVANDKIFTPEVPATCKDVNGEPAGNALSQSACEGVNTTFTVQSEVVASSCSDGTEGGTEAACRKCDCASSALSMDYTVKNRPPKVEDLRWIMNRSAWLHFFEEETIPDVGQAALARLWLSTTVNSACSRLDSETSSDNIASRFIESKEVVCGSGTSDKAVEACLVEQILELKRCSELSEIKRKRILDGINSHLTEIESLFLGPNDLDAMPCVGGAAPVAERTCTPASFADSQGFSYSGVAPQPSKCTDGTTGKSRSQCEGTTGRNFTKGQNVTCKYSNGTAAEWLNIDAKDESSCIGVPTNNTFVEKLTEAVCVNIGTCGKTEYAVEKDNTIPWPNFRASVNYPNTARSCLGLTGFQYGFATNSSCTDAMGNEINFLALSADEIKLQLARRGLSTIGDRKLHLIPRLRRSMNTNKLSCEGIRTGFEYTPPKCKGPDACAESEECTDEYHCNRYFCENSTSLEQTWNGKMAEPRPTLSGTYIEASCIDPSSDENVPLDFSKTTIQQKESCVGNSTIISFEPYVLTFKPALEHTYCKDGDGNDAYGGTRYTCEGTGVLGNFVAPKPRTCVDGLLDGNITIMASDNNKGTINFKSHPLGGNFMCEYAQDPFECMCTGLTHRIFSISKENYCLSEDGTRDNSRTTAQKCEKELEDGSYSKMGDFYVPITKSKCSDGCMISDPPNVTKDQCDELPGNYMFTESRQKAFCLKWLTSADDFPDIGSEYENLFVRRPGMPITRGITLTKQRQGFSNEFKILLKPDHLNFEEWKEELELDPSKDNYDTLNTECEYARKKSPFTCLIANVDVTYENVGDLTKGAWGAGRAFDGEYPSEEGYCTGFRNNNTWVDITANCTSSDGTVLFNDSKAVWNPEDIRSFRFKCEGDFTNSTYSPPVASECTNSSSKVYDHLHFLYGDLEFEMALLRGLLSEFPVETDEKLHPSSGMINADGNFVFTDKSFGFQKALYETAKTACQRHNTTNKYTESQDHAFKCMSEGVEQFDVLHFLVRHGTFTVKERLDFEIEQRHKLAQAIGLEAGETLASKIGTVGRHPNGTGFYISSAPSADFEVALFEAIRLTCEGASHSTNTFDQSTNTCVSRDGSYGGTREDCMGTAIIGNVYKLPHPSRCLDSDGHPISDPFNTITREECEGVRPDREYSAALNSTCKDNKTGEVMYSGMHITQAECEGVPTNHKYTDAKVATFETAKDTPVTSSTLWPCTENSSSIDLSSLCERSRNEACMCLAGSSQSLTNQTEMILAVASLIVDEERARAHSLNSIWDSIVDDAIFEESNRREKVLREVVSHGAYLGYHYLKEHYFYDRFYSVFGRDSAPNLNHGAFTGLEARAFEATSASNVVLNGDGAGIYMRSSYVKIDQGTRIVNSITEWGDGGAIQCMSSKLDIIGSTIKYNTALKGGGLYTKDCDLHASDSTSFFENHAYRDGGAVFLGVSSSAMFVDTEFKKNRVECPTMQYGQTVCPEWQNSTVGVQGALDAFCIHPSCKSHMGSGGAVYVAEADSVLLRHTNVTQNTATRGGGMFIKDTLRLDIIGSSRFSNNSCGRPFALVNLPTFTAGGGALYFDLTQYVKLDERPLISDTHFLQNTVLEGSGGAIFWSVPHTMIPVAKAAGGIVTFGASYDSWSLGDSGAPLARGNTAAWGGHFIQTSAFDLVVLEGPSRNPGAFVPKKEPCSTPVCPFHCSGAASIGGQQCISRASVTALVAPGTVTSGLPIEYAVGVEKLRVAVLDFYDNIVESATEVVFVEAAVDMMRAGLGPAYPVNSAGGPEPARSNCSEDSSNNMRPKLCSYKLSPEVEAVGAQEEASVVAVVPVRGIASFDRLALHADPSDRCFTSYSRKYKNKYPFRVKDRNKDMTEMKEEQAATKGRRLTTTLATTLDTDPHDTLPRQQDLRRGRPSHPLRRLLTEEIETIRFCTPKLYDLTISSVGNVGPQVRGVPEVAVSVSDCPPGKWLDRNYHSMFCTSCKVGRYTAEVNHNLDGLLQNDPCFRCPAGYYQDEVSRSSCKLCSMGRFSDSAESASCTLCFNGTVYNRNRREWCNGCPRGKVGNIGGLEGSQYTECLSCPPGRFQDETYSTYAISINKTGGKMISRHSTRFGDIAKNTWDCKYCPMGFFQQLAGSVGCEACPSGTFSERGQTKCESNCEKGTYRAKNTKPLWFFDPCVMCRQNNYAFWLKNECADCRKAHRGGDLRVADRSSYLRFMNDKGSFRQPEELCLRCPAGWHNGADGKGECKICEPGTFQSNEGTESCEECGKGFFSDKHGAISCKMCSTGFYQSENGKDQCSVCETGLFNRPKKADLWFVYIGANHTLCGGDKTLVPAEGMRSYLKTDGGYSKLAYHRAGWLGNASSAWLWDPQPIIGTSDFTIVHNDSTGKITHTDINVVEYSGFIWKFLLDEDTDELLEGALPEQDNEVERVHGEIYPYCRSERCKTDKTFAVGSSVLGKCQVESVKVPRVMQKDERQITRVLESKTVSQKCKVYRKKVKSEYSKCGGWGNSWWALGKVTHVNGISDHQRIPTMGGVQNVTADFAIPLHVWNDGVNRVDWPLHMIKKVGATVTPNVTIAFVFNPNVEEGERKRIISGDLDVQVGERVLALEIKVPIGLSGKVSWHNPSSSVSNSDDEDKLVVITQKKTVFELQKAVPNMTRIVRGQLLGGNDNSEECIFPHVPVGGVCSKKDIFFTGYPEKCMACRLGRWTGPDATTEPEHMAMLAKLQRDEKIELGRTEYGECQWCPPGWKGIPRSNKTEGAVHKAYSSCLPCGLNQYSNILGEKSCKTCPDKSWTMGTLGKEECHACVQGEIFASSGTRNCEKCRGVNEELVGDRGEYSLVAGGDRCHTCPPGQRCHGGTTMTTEWGWWMSMGRTQDRERVRFNISQERLRNRVLPRKNRQACEAQYLTKSERNSFNFTGELTDYEPHQCGDTCRGEISMHYCRIGNLSACPDGDAPVDNQYCNCAWSDVEAYSENKEYTSCGLRFQVINSKYVWYVRCTRKAEYIDPDCSCKTNSKGMVECKFYCDGQNEFRAGIFMDQCGLPLKATRCPGYQALVTCEMRFRELFRDLKDPNHYRTKIKMDKQCKSCRPTKIQSIQNVTADVVVEGGLGGIAVARLDVGDNACFRCLQDCDCTGTCVGSEGSDLDYGKCIKGTCEKRGCEAPKMCAAHVPADSKSATSVGESFCGVPVDVMWGFHNFNTNTGISEPWALDRVIPPEYLPDGGRWPLIVVSYNVPRAGTWDTEKYSSAWASGAVTSLATDVVNVIAGVGGIDKSDIQKTVHELREIQVALLPNDPRVPILLGLGKHEYFDEACRFKRGNGTCSDESAENQLPGWAKDKSLTDIEGEDGSKSFQPQIQRVARDKTSDDNVQYPADFNDWRETIITLGRDDYYNNMTFTPPIRITNKQECMKNGLPVLGTPCKTTRGYPFNQHIDEGCPFETLGCFKRGCPCRRLGSLGTGALVLREDEDECDPGNYEADSQPGPGEPTTNASLVDDIDDTKAGDEGSSARETDVFKDVETQGFGGGRRRRLTNDNGTADTTNSGTDTDSENSISTAGDGLGVDHDMFIGASDCNFMAGYHGRLCKQCLPGFSGKECTRCPPYDQGFTNVMIGVALSFVFCIIFIIAVVNEAGVTSTSTVTKRILATHLQTFSLLINFDLNWNTSLMNMFAFTGSVSSVGDDLINTGCVLGALDRRRLPLEPFYLSTLLFVLLPFALMVPGTIFFLVVYRPCTKEERENRPNPNKETRHIIEVIKHIKLHELQRELHCSKHEIEKSTDDPKKIQKRLHHAMERKRIRKEYNMLLSALQRASAEDKKLHHEPQVDHLAIGRIMARSLMDYINTHSINLRALFKEFKTKEQLKDAQKNPKIIEEVDAADFLTILHCLDLGWSEEEYMDIIELVATPGRVIKSKKKRRSVKAKLKKSKKPAKRGEYRVTIKHLQSFETSTKDRLVVMATVISFMLYPTISKKVFTSMSCFYGLMDGDYDWYLNSDLEIACTSPSHIWFIVTVIVPVIIAFVIGYPAVCVYSIWRVKKKHKRLTEKTSFRFAVFLSGYDRKHWYWESITCARKVLITMIAVFLGSFGPEKQFFFASLLLIVSMMTQLHIRPFESAQLNVFETSGLGILWFSLYFGIFFYWMLLSPDALGHLGTLIAVINGGFFMWGIGSWLHEIVSRTPEGQKSLRCFKDAKHPFILMLAAIPSAFIVAKIKIVGFFSGCYRNVKKMIRVGDGSGHVGKEEVINPTHLQKSQVAEMRAAIGMHIDEMKQLALAKENEVYKARLKMLNATNEEQKMMLQNRTGKNKLDIMAKTGDFVKKVGIIRDKRKKREMREARNERLRELGLEPPTDDDDSMFDFLNGSLLSNVMEVAGGDDELVEVDPIHDEELMELFNYGNDSDNESDAEIEEDLMKMFAAPEENLEMDSASGGLKFANSDEEEEADFLAELDKDLLFVDDGEAAVERARALEKHEKEKQAEEERAEQELKAQIESMKDGIQRMAIEDNTKRSRKERYKARRNRKNLGVRRSKGTDLDDFMDGKAKLHTASANSDGEKRFLSLAEERKERMESLNTKSRQEHRQSVSRRSDNTVSLDDLSHDVRDDDAGQTFMNRKSKRGSRKDVNDAASMATGASTGAPDNLESKRQMRKAKRKSRKEARSKMAQKMEQSLQQADVRDSENGAEDRATAANSASVNGAATKAAPAPGEAPDNLASKRQMRKAKRKSRKEARSIMAQKMEQSLQQADVRDSEKSAGSKEDGSLATQAAVTAPTAKPHFCAMCGTPSSGGMFCAGCGAPVVAAGAKAAEAKAAGAKKTKRKSGKKGKREKSSHTASGREEAL